MVKSMPRGGRNDPCPCGSGKKYKKCCLKSSATVHEVPKRIPRDVIDSLRKVRHEQEALEEKGIYVNYFRPIIHQGKKVWAVRHTVYLNRPPSETFHEFIIYFLRHSFGEDWWKENTDTHDKHFIVKCFLHFLDWRKEHLTRDLQVENALYAAYPDGLSRSLLALAFDIVSLEHTQKLPEQLKNRLKNKDQYQGARYEIAIAAIFARLDCEISFFDEMEKGAKHCEFIAKHRPTGTEIAVEVKSRHRRGVIHMSGSASEEKLLRGDVHHLLKEALEQNPGDKPFMIFLDLNSPLTPSVQIQDKPWFKDIWRMMEGYGAPTPESPDPFNAVFFTNYSFHYQTDKEADAGEYLSTIPLYSKHPLPEARFLEMLRRALDNYGNVPNLDVQGRPI